MADVMTPPQRSAFMSNIRPKGTGLELHVFSALRRAGLRFRRHVSVLPRCTPDVVFPAARAVVLIQGDFWHGWRFPCWKHKLAPFWKAKIETNRARDSRNVRALRGHGWRVLRIWEHEIERDLNRVVERIAEFTRIERPMVSQRSATTLFREFALLRRYGTTKIANTIVPILRASTRRGRFGRIAPSDERQDERFSAWLATPERCTWP